MLRTKYVPSILLDDDSRGGGGMTSLCRFDIRTEIRATKYRNKARRAASKGGERPAYGLYKALKVI